MKPPCSPEPASPSPHGGSRRPTFFGSKKCSITVGENIGGIADLAYHEAGQAGLDGRGCAVPRVGAAAAAVLEPVESVVAQGGIAVISRLAGPVAAGRVRACDREA